ncbi:MAG: helix-turn-helix domain-containing protein [Candidatus ainarchaeum sp.]|nr:helix-turn-helix domain-containing protein [Candidatus ainarchaeum sp.]
MRIPEMQRKIAVLLLTEPKTAEDINKQLDIGYAQVTKELNNMLKQGLIKKQDGFPTKYTLDDYIIETVKKRKQISENDSYKLKVRAIIELQGIDKDLVRVNLEKIEKMMTNEKDFTIYDSKISEILEQDNMFFGYIDATLSLKSFSTLIYFVSFYTPTSVEVIAPEKYDISMYELQDGIMDLSALIQKYVAEIHKRLSQEEVKKMQDKLFKAN